PGEDLVERLGPVGRRAMQALLHLGGRGSPDRRLVALQPLDQQVDRAVAQLAHRLGIECQWVVVTAPLHGGRIVNTAATAAPGGVVTARWVPSRAGTAGSGRSSDPRTPPRGASSGSSRARNRRSSAGSGR